MNAQPEFGPPPLRLLLIEDSDADAALVTRELKRSGFVFTSRRVTDLPGLEEALREPWDFVICDYQLPQLNAPRALQAVRRVNASLPVIVVSGTVGEESAVTIMKAGAQDYLMKDRLFRLGEIVRRELAEAEVRRQRNAAEAALRTSEEQLRLALDAAHMGIWDWDIRADVVSWSPNAVHILGSSMVQSPSYDDFLAQVYSDDREAFDKGLRECLRGVREEFSLEHRVFQADGGLRWVEVRGRAFFDDHMKPVRMAGTVMDATRRRALEDQLVQSQKLEVLGRMAGGIAHDFNNLLTVIRASCQLIESMLPPGHELLELTEPAADAAERATALTRQLLIFSRPEALAPRILSLNVVLAGLVKLLPRLVGEDTRIEMKLSPEAWYIRMDPTRCEQILINLAVNARDAMPRGGHLRINTTNLERDAAAAVDGLAPGDWIRLDVADTGQGMTSDVQRRIFEPFFTTKGGHGTGLGLATVHSAVTQAGGHIHVTSVEGQGTTFSIFLPRSLELPEAKRPVTSEFMAFGSSRTVLLVEDDDLVRTIAVRALRRHGYNVLVASNGADALALLAAHPDDVQLLLTDVVMPQMSGVELVEKATALRPDLRVLFTSGYTDERLSHHGLGDRKMSILLKPYTALELSRRVYESLAGL